MASLTDFYSKEFAVEKCGPGLEKVKVKFEFPGEYERKDWEYAIWFENFGHSRPFEDDTFARSSNEFRIQDTKKVVGYRRNLSDKYLW